ncbi:lanthionine synthetase LanC family protein [Kutzneria albida]|uniref:Uncharacterized protein n=1 Tax=Kutzneria albida DSM 43870 TaxID=1449976 RepID=W5WDP8_9PSEU|nr:lanthionine synthetase LanC family protein [Kutzneria albida]AHH99303.1 hypothetical protein KALB_5942 [Kutzneria albida DSM 43870]
MSWQAVHGLAGRPRHTPDRVRPDLADGGPGLALAYHQLDRCQPGRGWGEMARGYLAASAAGAQRLGGTGAAPGLYGGLAGLALAAWIVTGDPGVLPEVHDSVLRQALVRAEALADPAPERAVDLISGLTGTAAYLLCRHPETDHVLRAVLSALVAQRYELDCGVAHGDSGPLALLCLAADSGVVVPGQHEAIVRLAARQVEELPFVSWCRGGAGLACALWAAGVTLNDVGLRERAVRTLKSVHRRAVTTPYLGLCHGKAGLLIITNRFARLTGDGELVAAADRLLAEVAATPVTSGPGLLDGAAGVVLALLAALTEEPPTWARVLLLC